MLMIYSPSQVAAIVNQSILLELFAQDTDNDVLTWRATGI